MAKLSTLDLVARANAGTTFSPTYPALDADTGKYAPILSADGTPATLTMLGSDSDIAKRLNRQQRATLQNRLSAMAFRGEKQEGLTEDDLAAQEAHDLEIVIACTVAWTGFEDDDDDATPCTPETVRAVYESAPYLVEQAMRHLRDRSRFFDLSLTRSGLQRATVSA